MQFNNRYDAALQLIPLLEKYKNEQEAVIFAIPRGGVPIGYHVATHFNFPLELLLTKKIELAIGVVSLEDYIIDEQHDIPHAYIENEVKKIKKSLQERYKMFMGEGHVPIGIKNKVVIIVNDGVALDNTILPAIKMLRKQHPKKTVIAVPVASPETVKQLKEYADDVICLYSPEDFPGVGQFYLDFCEVGDKEVIELLQEANYLYSCSLKTK